MVLLYLFPVFLLSPAAFNIIGLDQSPFNLTLAFILTYIYILGSITWLVIQLSSAGRKFLSHSTKLEPSTFKEPLCDVKADEKTHSTTQQPSFFSVLLQVFKSAYFCHSLVLSWYYAKTRSSIEFSIANMVSRSSKVHHEKNNSGFASVFHSSSSVTTHHVQRIIIPHHFYGPLSEDLQIIAESSHQEKIGLIRSVSKRRVD